MRLADYFRGRGDKMICTLCKYVAKDEKELDGHIRQSHSK
jgi:hypothetical protein